MDRKEKARIRQRDKREYCKMYGPIPEGMTMHHNYYNELWYDEGSFIIITKEEHEWIHGHKIQASSGYDHSQKLSKEYKKEYNNSHKEERKAYWHKYSESHKEERRIKNHEYYVRKKLEKERGEN